MSDEKNDASGGGLSLLLCLIVFFFHIVGIMVIIGFIIYGIGRIIYDVSVAIEKFRALPKKGKIAIVVSVCVMVAVLIVAVHL